MTIFRKDHLIGEKTDLALFYKELTEALEGRIPSESMAEHYQNNVPDFQRDYTDIDLTRLSAAIGHLKVTLDSLKKIKAKAQKKAG